MDDWGDMIVSVNRRLLAEKDTEIATLRTRLAAIEAVMPSDDERDALRSCVTEHMPSNGSFERAFAWFARIDAAQNEVG